MPYARNIGGMNDTIIHEEFTVVSNNFSRRISLVFIGLESRKGMSVAR
jgi:hypothetical protein